MPLAKIIGNRTLLYVHCFLFLGTALAESKELELRGVLRNDALANSANGKYLYADILENRLVLEKNADTWKLYTDGRLYLFYPEPGEDKKEYQANLIRSFIRYYSPIGDFTLGKTYVNFGNMGVFNPFEIDKKIILSDLAYDKSGILALEYAFPSTDLSGGKAYIGTQNTQDPVNGEKINPVMSGASLNFHIRSFDTGLVFNHKAEDANLAGWYFKGDLIIGVQGSYAFHFNDILKSSYNEATLGLDYSFLDGHLVITLLGYYNQVGAGHKEDYGAIQPLADKFFQAKIYVFGNIRYLWDEFLNFDLSTFVNMVDRSALFIPALNIILANGLTLTLQGAIISGKNDQEFSRDIFGDFSVLLRVEAKY